MAVFEIEMYDRRVFTSQLKGFTLERRGETVTLGIGDEFYMRPATSKKGTWRVVLGPHSNTKVFSIDENDAQKLRNNSLGVDDDA